MTALLYAYDLPDARRRLLARKPEVKRALDLLGALLAAQSNAQLDGPNTLRADAVAAALRKALGQALAIEEMPLDERLGLLRIMRACRDADLVLSWPYNPTSTGMTVEMTAPAAAALARLEDWDPPTAALDTDGHPTYPDARGVVPDLAALVGGVSMGSAQ
jgi:hypothetical protein